MKTFDEFCQQYGYDEESAESKIAFEAYSRKIAAVENLELIPRISGRIEA